MNNFYFVFFLLFCLYFSNTVIFASVLQALKEIYLSIKMQGHSFLPDTVTGRG